MCEFLNAYDFPKLNQEEIMNISGSITSDEIGTGIKRPSKMAAPSVYWYLSSRRSETMDQVNDLAADSETPTSVFSGRRYQKENSNPRRLTTPKKTDYK